jgi:uncharacterized protein (TIGR02246 family)
MPEEQVRNIVRSFLQASASRDANKAISLVADDAVMVSWGKTFRGKASIGRYIASMISNTTENKITETGVGIITQGDTAIVEHIMSGAVKGKRFDTPAVCIYEIRNNKIQMIRGFNDRLDMIKQVSTGFTHWIVTQMTRVMEKGMSFSE